MLSTLARKGFASSFTPQKPKGGGGIRRFFPVELTLRMASSTIIPLASLSMPAGRLSKEYMCADLAPKNVVMPSKSLWVSPFTWLSFTQQSGKNCGSHINLTPPSRLVYRTERVRWRGLNPPAPRPHFEERNRGYWSRRTCVSTSQQRLCSCSREI